MNTPVAIYARVSQDEQSKGYSLPTQLEGCRNYADEHGCTVVGEFSDDFTGTSLDRPELDKVRALAQAGSIQKVVVYELDRLARGMVKQILLEEELAKMGVTVEYVLADYENNPEGRLQKNVRAVVAEYEREKIIERSTRGKKGRAKAGSVNPGRVSRYGYKYTPNPEGHKGTYVIVDEEAKIVQLMYSWYVHGDEQGQKMGMNKIAKRLTEMRIPTRFDTVQPKKKGATVLPKKRGVCMWAESTVRDILSSEIYAGTHYYNRLNPKRGKGEDRVRDQSEWIPIAVPAIVSRELWETAQHRRNENKKVATRNTRHPYLMRSRLRCTKCGYMLGCRTDLRFTPARGQYVCNRGKVQYYEADLKTPFCRGTIKSGVIDDAVWSEIKRLLQSPQVIIDAMQQEINHSETAKTVICNRLEIAEHQLATLADQRKRLLDLYLNGDVPKNLLDDKMAELKQTSSKFEEEIVSLHDQLEAYSPTLTDVTQVQKFCAQLQGELDDFTFEDRQAVIDMLNVTALVTKDEHGIRLVLSGYFPDVETDAIDRETSR